MVIVYSTRGGKHGLARSVVSRSSSSGDLYFAKKGRSLQESRTSGHVFRLSTQGMFIRRRIDLTPTRISARLQRRADRRPLKDITDS